MWLDAERYSLNRKAVRKSRHGFLASLTRDVKNVQNLRFLESLNFWTGYYLKSHRNKQPFHLVCQNFDSKSKDSSTEIQGMTWNILHEM